MTGKQKCKILKEIRKQIAENNDIRFVIEECTHKGKCRGTCPRCEWEVRMLERELEKRRASGKRVVLAGISAGFLLTSCAPIDTVKDIVSSVVNPLEGDMQVETATMGVPVPGEVAVSETEEETGEVIPDDVTEVDGALPIDDDAENCKIPGETEDEDLQIAGGLLPMDQDEEGLVLEGDIRYPAQDEEEQP